MILFGDHQTKNVRKNFDLNKIFPAMPFIRHQHYFRLRII